MSGYLDVTLTQAEIESISHLWYGDLDADQLRGIPANATAALSTTGYGAVAPIPRPDAVRALLKGQG